MISIEVPKVINGSSQFRLVRVSFSIGFVVAVAALIYRW